MVRWMITQANLLISFKGVALSTATYILNWVPTKSVYSMTYKQWTGCKPDHLRPSGPLSKFDKLGPQVKNCIFIRYHEHSKGYVFIGKQVDESKTEL